MSIAAALGLLIAGLVWIGIRKPIIVRASVVLLIVLTIGCDKSQPKAIWCDTGTGPAQVVYPRAISYSSKDDSFFIIDRMARVQHLDRKGGFLNEWRMPDWKIGKPVGVTVGPDGNVYVPDTHYQRVIVYSPAGKELRRFGERGDKPGQFIWPTDIAFDKAGNRDGEFSRPQSMVIDGDYVYVTDACNHRIVVFKTDGTFVRNMGELGSGIGQFRFPFGLDEDAKGRLVVCEFGNNR